jgi:signal transduction histidine kinase
MTPDPKELYPELWEENARLRSLVELTRVLADPQEPLERKLDECVRALARLTKAESCSLMLVEDDELVVRAANHSQLVGLATLFSEASIATEVFRSGQAIYAKEVRESNYAGVSRQNGKYTYRTGSLISLPLMEGDQVVGVLNLADKVGAPYFSEQDAEAAQGIAQEISRLVHFSAMHSSLEKAYRELSEAQRAKDELMHLIFHDMKAPITAVKEVLGFLEPSSGLSAEEKSLYLSAARGDLEQLWRRITNLLDIKRMEEGQYPLNLMALNLADMAREAVESLLPLSRSQGVELELETGAAPKVMADEDLLERILMNLLLNASKHSIPENGGKGRVTLSVGNDGSRAWLEVADSGAGVDPALGEAIFDRFVSGGLGRGSTGLGLYFCRRAAGLMGGEVGYKNMPEGALFYLNLPLDEEI